MAKQDALAAQAIADGTLYDAGFTDGVASVGNPAGTVSSTQEQTDIAAAVAAAVQPLNDQIAAFKLAKTTEDALLASVQQAAAAVLALFTPATPAA